METKTCNRCNTEKTTDSFSPASFTNGKQYYRGECKECNRVIQKMPGPKAAQKRYRSTEKYQNTRKEYRAIPEVKEKELAHDRTPDGRKKKREQKKRLYDTDPLNNLKVRLRARFRGGLTAKNIEKRVSVGDLIGMPLPEFKEYIEKQFQPGMSWEDTGSFHIDHKIPLDSANTEQELYDLWNYKNLQPLFPTDNLKKSNN
jgi:hypothetical protein